MLIGLVAAVLGVSELPRDAPPDTRFVNGYAAVLARQPFYPLGVFETPKWSMSYSLFGGDLTVMEGGATRRVAVLMNVVRSPRGRMKIVEIGALDCPKGLLAPSYRMFFSGDGEPLPNAGGPVGTADRRDTMLTFGALAGVVEIVCKGSTAAKPLEAQALAEFP